MVAQQEEIKDDNYQPTFRPATDVFKMFSLSKFPYSSRISFLPLIKYWESKLNSKNISERLIAAAINKLLKEKGDTFRNPIEDMNEFHGMESLVQLLISIYIPYQDQDTLLRITGPFNTLPFYHSKTLSDLLGQASIQTSLDKTPEKINHLILYRAGCMILNQFYGQQLKLDIPYTFSVKQEEPALELHYQTYIDSRFAEVKKLKPLKRLTNAQIHDLLSNVDDMNLWLKHLPPANFEFQGIFCTILIDASESETLSRIKDKLLQRDALISEEKVQLLQNDLCTFFKQPDLKLGVCTVDRLKMKGLNKKYGIKHGLVNNKFPDLLSSKVQDSIYEKAVQSKDFVIIEDLRQYPNPTSVESELLMQGIRNILVAPLKNTNKEVIGLLELANPKPFMLNSLSAVKLKGILSLFDVAIERSQAEIVNQLEAIIRKHFTSIHPSVEWAFVKRAFQILGQKKEKPQARKIILFLEIITHFMPRQIS